MTTLYFNVKGGLKTGNIVLDAATGNITGIENATLGNLVTANYFSGDGSALTGLNASNLASGTISSGILGNSTVYIGTTGVALNRTSGSQSLTGVSIDGSAGSATTAGTVTTNAQPNITSTGTLSSLDVTANVTAGNISSQGVINSTGNVTAPFFIGNVVGNISGTITVPGNNTSVLFNQTGNAGASDALTFNYSSNILTVGGNLTSQNANLGNLAVANYISGNGSLLTSLTGANVTGTVGSATTAATVTTNAQPNITSLGTLSSLSVTANITSGNIDGGNLVTANYFSGNGASLTGLNASNLASGTISSGILGNSTLYVGTTSIELNRSSGSQSLTGITSIDGYAATVSTAAQPNITSTGTLSGLTVSGSATITGNLTVSGTFTHVNVSTLDITDPIIEQGGGANGAALSTNDGKDRGSLLHYYTTKTVDAFMGWDNSNGEFAFGSNVSTSSDVVTFNTFGNVRASTFIGSLSGAATTAATVTTNAQPNITSTGTLNGLTATGTVNLTGASNVALGPVGNVHITGGSSGYLLTTDGSGGLSWSAPASSTSIVNGTSNVNIGSSGGNVTTSVGGTANVLVVDAGGANISGNLTVSGNLIAGNLVTGGSAGNISGANYIIANYFQGDGSALTNLNASNISSGTISSGILGNSTVYIGTTSVALNRSSGSQSLTGITSIDGYAATVSTAAQPNITSTGTLNGLTATATVNLTGASNVSLGPVANVHISGGTSGYLLSTNGSGTLSWTAPPSATSIVNGTSNVNIASSGGNVTTSVGGTSNVVVVTTTGANFAGYVNLTGNLTAANAALGNLVSANFFSGNGSLLTSLTGANVTGTVSAASVANTVADAAQANITSLGTLTSVAVTGNATVGNVKINGGITSNRSNVSVSTNTVIDEFAPSTYRTAKYVVSASNSNGYQSAEIILVHNDTTSYISIYGSVCSNTTADIVDFTSNVNPTSGNVTVYATGSSVTLNLVATYLKT